MFSWYKYLIVGLVFPHLGFWSGSLFLIAHFPDLCLLVLFFSNMVANNQMLMVLFHKNALLKLFSCILNLNHKPAIPAIFSGSG